MALLTKAQIAAILDIATDDISDTVYTLAKAQFFVLTNLKEAEEEKTYNKFIGNATLWIPLPDDNIDSIDSLTIGDTEVTVTSDNVKFNPDSGLLYYSGGFSGGELVTIEYTVSAYTFKDIHNYLLTLLVLKQVTIFSPSVVDNVRSFKIGRYSKTFGSAANNQEESLQNLDMAIQQAIDMIQGDDGRLETGTII